MRVHDQRGVVGLVILGLVVLVFVAMALIYALDVRSGQRQPIGDQVQHLFFGQQ